MAKKKKPNGEKKPRGFAAMTPKQLRELARQGGVAAHEKGAAHQFTSDEARAAGRVGGKKTSADLAHMSEIGKLGGRARAKRMKEKDDV